MTGHANRARGRLAMCLLTVVLSVPGHAAPGHDHGTASNNPATTAAPTPAAPQRLPDGSVRLPKPAQHQIGIRTAIVRPDKLARSIELTGKVMMDPNAGGKVQALIAGRIEPGPRGLPGIGQRVAKGEVLAHVLPTTGQIERANQIAQLAELRAARDLAEKRLARLNELVDTVPKKEIEAAQSELASLTARASAVGGGLTSRDALIAPVTGVITTSNVVAGQVVDARELVFEIVDPGRFRIEALAYDTSIVNDIGKAHLVQGRQSIPLVFLGAARSLREQALPLAFRAEGAALSTLAVGLPVKVLVQTATLVQGMRVTAAAVVKSPSNQNIVWVKTAPEQFVPRTVTIEPLDGTDVAITSGLQSGDRVVTAGATLLNQVR